VPLVMTKLNWETPEAQVRAESLNCIAAIANANIEQWQEIGRSLSGGFAANVFSRFLGRNARQELRRAAQLLNAPLSESVAGNS